MVPYTVGAFGILAGECFTRKEAKAALPCTLSSMEGTHYQRGPVIASPTLLPSIVQLARQANRMQAMVAKRYRLEAPVREEGEEPKLALAGADTILGRHREATLARVKAAASAAQEMNVQPENGARRLSAVIRAAQQAEEALQLVPAAQCISMRKISHVFNVKESGLKC